MILVMYFMCLGEDMEEETELSKIWPLGDCYLGKVGTYKRWQLGKIKTYRRSMRRRGFIGYGDELEALTEIARKSRQTTLEEFDENE